MRNDARTYGELVTSSLCDLCVWKLSKRISYRDLSQTIQTPFYDKELNTSLVFDKARESCEFCKTSQTTVKVCQFDYCCLVLFALAKACSTQKFSNSGSTSIIGAAFGHVFLLAIFNCFHRLCSSTFHM